MTPRGRQISYIIEETALEFGLTPDEIIIRGNRGQIVDEVRRIAMYLARDISEFSYPAMAYVFQRDQSTISVGVRSVRELLRDYPNGWTARRIRALRERLERALTYPRLIEEQLQSATVNPDREGAMSQEQEGMLL